MARRFIWSGERRGARDRESERARRCHAAYESCTDVSPVAFTVRLQHQNAEAGGTNPIVHLQALVRQRRPRGSRAGRGLEPSTPWIATRLRVCVSAHMHVSSLSLLLISLCLSLCTARVSWPPASALRALAACNYCVLRTPNRKFPPPRPHEVGVGGACRLGSLNGADQAPTAQGRLLA